MRLISYGYTLASKHGDLGSVAGDFKRFVVDEMAPKHGSIRVFPFTVSSVASLLIQKKY
jgi:hypothetical protein